MPVPISVLDTGRFPRADRFPVWREALSPSHDVLLPEDHDGGHFSAAARCWYLGNVLVLESRSTPQRLQRTSRTIRADQIDHYIIRLQKAGAWTGEVGGQSVTATPGTVMVLDMARGSEAQTTEIENINLLVPRDALDDLLPPFHMHGLVLQHSLATLLRSHLSELAANLPNLQVNDAQRVAGATLNLVAACLAPSRDAEMRARAPLEAALMAEIRRYINSNLHSPDLSPQSICKALGLSRTRLYAICEPMGGVAAFIQQRRLRRIHAILADSRDRRRIAEIAFEHGFVSEAHFSRAFRRAFGYSPREVREASAAHPSSVLGPDCSVPGPADYEAWLRQLGS